MKQKRIIFGIDDSIQLRYNKFISFKFRYEIKRGIVMDNREWFKQAKYGMMVHFGLYSLLGGEYRGRRMGTTIGEWAQAYFRIPNREYEKLAEAFNPIF